MVKKKVSGKKGKKSPSSIPADKGLKNVVVKKRSLSNDNVTRKSLVNGKGSNRGLTNGNGLINDNSLMNGKRGKRGLTNGNGLVNGRRGKRGLTNGNGLVNGTGLINGNGLVNGKGLTNGRNRVRSIPRPVRKKTNPWVVLGASILVVLIIFSAVIVASKYNLIGQSGVFINGNFDDWKGANLYTNSQSGQTVNTDVSLVKFGAQMDSKYLSFYDKVSGKMLGGKGNDGLDQVSIYIDADKSYSTGYHIGTLGADYLLRVEGFNGKISSKNFWKFNTSRDSMDFNGFSQGLRVSAASSGSELEAQISLADTTMKKDSNIACVMQMQDKAGNTDQSFVFNNKKGALVSTLTFTAVGHLSKITNVELGTLSLAAFKAPATVSSVSLNLKGTVTAADFSKIVLASDTGSATFTGTFSSGNIVFSTGTYIVPKDSVSVLKVRADISSSAGSGHTLGLEFSGVNAVSSDANSLTQVEYPSLNVYLGSPLSQIIIDGAFEDWNSVSANPDPSDMTANPNIDLRDVRLSSDTSDLFFYFRVDGTVMKGTNSPRALIRPVPGPGGSSGAQPPLPVVFGADSAYIFIDTDNKASTGYSIDTIGADYMVQIMGVGGRIDSSISSSFSGKSQAEWSWKGSQSVKAANDATRVECSVSSQSMGIGAKGFQAVVKTTDWQLNTDILNEVLSGTGNRTLEPGHPDLKVQKNIDLKSGYPLDIPEFKELLVPMLGTVAIVVVIRRRGKNQ